MNAAIRLSTEGRYIGGDTHPPTLLNRVMLSAAKHLVLINRKVQPCHAERSEASHCLSRQTLRFAQGDTV